MATQIQQLASIENDQAYVRCQYDDVTRIANRVMWANLLPVPVLCWANKQDGTVLIDRATIPPNTAEQSRNLAGPNRFNLDTEYPSVNLSS